MTEQDSLNLMMGPGKYAAFDLDGTSAKYEGFRGHDHIGDPIPTMIERIQRFRAEGREVRLFTARASVPAQIPPVQAWSARHIGEVLPVTCVKDFALGVLYDDRAIQVVPNSGKTLEEVLRAEIEQEVRDRLIAEGWTPPVARCA
jgi:hypothetical protein